MAEKVGITNWVISGDSLTDRGEMGHRYLWNIIPMRYLSGLAGKSPLNRFTNRFTWADHFFDLVIKKLGQANSKEEVIDDGPNETIIESQDFESLKLKPCPKSSDDIQQDERMIKSHAFDDYRYIEYQGHKDFVRCYAEGGLSAHHYRGFQSSSITQFFTRLIVSNLGEMRERLLKWDKIHKPSDKQKAHTLVIEWSGANDFVTVNERPSIVEAQKAVTARIKNVKKLIKKGYQHFVLFNLPDLSLTPLFQNLSAEERANATKCTETFNQELMDACREVQITFPHCKISIFDVHANFKSAFDQPALYGFDPSKKTENYCDSNEFQDKVDDKDADDYMFWNYLHPSDRMHRLLAVEFKKEVQKKYNFLKPEQLKSFKKSPLDISEKQLRLSFRGLYEKKLDKSLRTTFFGSFTRSKLDYRNASLETILNHALKEKGKRTFEVIKDLQWINEDGSLKLNIPALNRAFAKIDDETSPLLLPPIEF